MGPQSDLNFDQAGNIYGTTNNGGSPGNGIVFELTPGQGGVLRSETVLHRFIVSEGYQTREPQCIFWNSRRALWHAR